MALVNKKFEDLRRQRLRRGRPFLVSLLIITLGVVGAGQLAAQDADTVSKIAAARKSISEWVQVQRTISEEKQEWRLSKEMLQDRIDVVQSEIETLKKKIEQAETNITEEDERRAELVEQNEDLKALADKLRDTISNFESRMRSLLGRLPEPATEPVQPLIQRMPDDSAETDQSLSKRYQNITGILNELDKFNTKITVASEVRDVEDGRAQVSTLYFGLGQAFYVGQEKTIAGYGTAGPERWQWRQTPEAGARIAEAIAVYQNEQVASFVLLPAEIK